MTTAAELRASQHNPREGTKIDFELLDGKDIVVTSAHYRRSNYPSNANAGNFPEYLVLNFYRADDKKKTPYWIQTQAVALFKLFRTATPADFPVTGTVSIDEDDEGRPMYSLK